MARVDLYIMRHGDALGSSDDGDFGRKLSEHGRSQAKEIRSKIFPLLEKEIHYVISSAVRTQETYSILSHGSELSHTVCEKLYLASPDTIEARLSEFVVEKTELFIVGHNPGLSYFLSELIGRPVGLSTAEFFHVTYNGNESNEHSIYDKGNWIVEVSHKV